MSKHNQIPSLAPSDMAKAEQNFVNEDKPVNMIPNNEQRAAVIMKNASKPVSPYLSQFNTLCNNFIAVKTGEKLPKKVGTEIKTYAQRSIEALSKIMNFIWAHQDDLEVLNAYRKFMYDNYNTYMSTTEALQGMNFVKSENERNRYSIMYMLMYELINPTRTRINYDYDRATRICQNPNCPNPNGLVQYVSSRMR